MTSHALRIELSPPPQVQAHLGGRNFASCVALGRNFSATFRKAPPAHAQLRPLRPEAEEWSRARAGGGSKGYAEIHTQGDARREASPSWGVCQQVRTKKSTRFCKIVARCVHFFVRTCSNLFRCLIHRLCITYSKVCRLTVYRSNSNQVRGLYNSISKKRPLKAETT